jgi:NYN domain
VITNVYIDGFNLYYGCLRGSPYKWLDLGKLCAMLLPGNEIHRIRYFTARIQARPQDPDGPNRQDTYLAALGSVPNLTVHYGHFLASQTKAMLVNPPAPPASPIVWVHKMEEKGSDVNLATWMLTDAFEDECELAVLVTNDSDLAEPMKVVAERYGRSAGLINPHPRRASSRALAAEPDLR